MFDTWGSYLYSKGQRSRFDSNGFCFPSTIERVWVFLLTCKSDTSHATSWMYQMHPFFIKCSPSNAMRTTFGLGLGLWSAKGCSLHLENKNERDGFQQNTSIGKMWIDMALLKLLVDNYRTCTAIPSYFHSYPHRIHSSLPSKWACYSIRHSLPYGTIVATFRGSVQYCCDWNLRPFHSTQHDHDRQNTNHRHHPNWNQKPCICRRQDDDDQDTS